MSQAFDLSQFPDLPPEVVKAFEAVQFELSVERAARQHEQAVGAEKDVFITELKDLIAKLEGQVGQYRLAKFGPKSEKLDPAQLELAQEDLETAIAETQAQIAAVEEKIAASAADPDKAAPRVPRKARALPETLPREERWIEPDSIACPCGCGDMVRIGEDRTERLDPPRANSPPDCLLILVDPGALSGDRYGATEIRLPQRPRRGGSSQSPGTPPGGQLADRGAVGAVRCLQTFRTHATEPSGGGHGPIRGADRAVGAGRLDGPTGWADWMGRTGVLIAPVVDRMAVLLKQGSTRLYVDEATAPVLDPGRGKTKTGYLWAMLRDDRGWNGPAPPGVVFHYHPGRKGEDADQILSGFDGIIQVDAYGGYSHLARLDRKGGKPLKLAFCWAHGRRKLIAVKPQKGSPIVDEALLRIAALYKVEDAIRGTDPDRRRAVRQKLSRPLVDAFFAWLTAQAKRVPRKSDLGEAIAYMLKRQDGFRLFLDDGRVDMDSNLVENAIRSPAMNRRNALFAGHDEGGRNWARFASLIGTCKMNGAEPNAYLRDLFTKLANTHPDKDIDALMPWTHASKPTTSK